MYLIAQDKDAFEAEKAAMRVAGSLGDIVELNVGGVLMTTTRSTLTQACCKQEQMLSSKENV